VTGRQRPDTSPDDMIRLVLALGNELAKRSPRTDAKAARREIAG
jgi:hypothetical protein